MPNTYSPFGIHSVRLILWEPKTESTGSSQICPQVELWARWRWRQNNYFIFDAIREWPANLYNETSREKKRNRKVKLCETKHCCKLFISRLNDFMFILRGWSQCFWKILYHPSNPYPNPSNLFHANHFFSAKTNSCSLISVSCSSWPGLVIQSNLGGHLWYVACIR